MKSARNAPIAMFPMAPRVTSVDPEMQYGVTGIRMTNGIVRDEFLYNLQGIRGRRVYREMRDNDDVVGPMMYAIEMLLRGVPWEVAPRVSEDGTLSPEAQKAAQFVHQCLFEDMDNTWDNFITDVTTMFVYGWALFEVLFKRRVGPDESDVSRRSLFSDGLVGFRKFALRDQHSIIQWDIDQYDELLGAVQQARDTGQRLYLPMGKCILLRTCNAGGNPEGRSLLRNAYRPWYFKKNIEEIEAIAIERELNGLPVVRLPKKLLSSTDPTDRSVVQSYTNIVRNIKLNEQGGLIIPSDAFLDADGKPTGVKEVDIELIASKGTRAIDTSKVVTRYSQAVARCTLADFILLGSNDRGSFALSKDKTSLFLKAAEGHVENIADSINGSVLPLLWRVNGLDTEIMPRVTYGDIAPETLEEFTRAIRDLSAAGMPLFPDEDLEQHVRERIGVPVKGSEGLL